MENMKMSDVFDLPLQRAVSELAIVDKNDCVVGWADAFSGEVARDCIVESINNHDRLIEENKQQRESLDAFRELVKAQTKTMSELVEENAILEPLVAEKDEAIQSLIGENAELREMLYEYLSAAEAGSFGRMGGCYKKAKNLLNKND